MVAKRPNARASRTARVQILVQESTALGVALLMRDILLRTNGLAGRELFAVRLVGRPGLRAVDDGPVTVRLARAAAPADHLLVPPFVPGPDAFAPRPAEARVVRRLHEGGAAVHAACLGSLLLAQAGLLAGREATTHWAWVERATERFPEVRWDAGRMLCDGGDVVTSGGYLAAVDLTLALVERVAGRALSHALGRALLADSVRQRQSVYATSLVSARVEDPRMQRLERWLSEHLSAPVTVAEMAAACHLSPRTFHRELVRAYGCTPKKLVQLKRVERMREILRRPDLSVEQAMAQVGVSDVPSFRKVFQRELGLSPAEYRRRLRSEGAAER